MNTSEILDRAADLIEQRGLAKGVFYATDGRVCAGGAVRMAAGVMDSDGYSVNDVSDASWDGYQSAFECVIGHLRTTSLAEWSDAPGRTVDQVADALRGAAEAARADQTGGAS